MYDNLDLLDAAFRDVERKGSAGGVEMAIRTRLSLDAVDSPENLRG